MSKEKHVLHQEFFINNWLDDLYLNTGLVTMKKILNQNVQSVQRQFLLSSAGRPALTDHCKHKKHMEAKSKRCTFFHSQSNSDIESTEITQICKVDLIMRY